MMRAMLCPVARALMLLSAIVSALVLAAPAQAQNRVASIGGAVTEIVFALGQQDRLVARDTTSTWPPAAADLPDLGYMRALSPEGVLSVRPDLILMEDGAGPPEALEALAAAGVPIVTIPQALTIDGVLTRIEVVAAALDAEAEGAALATRLGAEMQAALRAADPGDAPRPRVLFVLSNSGGRLMGAGSGTAAAAMIELAGGQNAVTGFSGYKALGDEAVAAAMPDIILAMDRGDAGASGAGQAADYLTHPALARTPAGQAGRAITLPGLLLLGFGPRTPEAIRSLHDAMTDVMAEPSSTTPSPAMPSPGTAPAPDALTTNGAAPLVLPVTPKG